ncbi:MAG: class I SAM-dependent rRNA methyltransferase [Opitutaceae bacterium]
MDLLSEQSLASLQTVPNYQKSGHPWVALSDLVEDASVEPGSAVHLVDAEGESFGCGLYDPRDARRAWRRYSFAEGVAFDEAYLATAIHEALSRRGDEGCQRLVSSDADYLPGLIVEQYEQVISITAKTAAIDARLPIIAEILKEACQPQEIVFLNHVAERELYGLERVAHTQSGNNLKGRWVELDGVFYRVDWLSAEKPGIFLDQREQHLLLGSLCEGRCVLDAHSHNGGFALHALRAGAEHVVALDHSEICVKAIGAHAQRNECFVETMHCDAGAFLAERAVGDFDCIVLDPPAADVADFEVLHSLHVDALRCLPSGGILATYARSEMVSLDTFERFVATAAAEAGREGRIFARTGQPFDFPTLLNLPESSYLKGLILQVE